MLRLEKLHPISQLLFFAFTLIVPITFNNPCFSVASLFAALLYLLSKKAKTALKSLIFAVTAILAVGAFNMLFAHYGETVLFTLRKTSFTLESLSFGLSQGCVLASVMIWFTVLGKCIDSERLVYLFRFSPKLALMFSMALGFIPRFIKKEREIREARLGLNFGKTPETFREKLRFTTENFSALVSYSLESSIVTSNSMLARGWNPKAIRAERFKPTVFDICFTALTAGSFAFNLVQFAIGNIKFIFDPVCYMKALSIPALAAFAVIELYPFISELRENIKWKLLSVKV